MARRLQPPGHPARPGQARAPYSLPPGLCVASLHVLSLPLPRKVEAHGRLSIWRCVSAHLASRLDLGSNPRIAAYGKEVLAGPQVFKTGQGVCLTAGCCAAQRPRRARDAGGPARAGGPGAAARAAAPAARVPGAAAGQLHAAAVLGGLPATGRGRLRELVRAACGSSAWSVRYCARHQGAKGLRQPVQPSLIHGCTLGHTMGALLVRGPPEALSLLPVQ